MKNSPFLAAYIECALWASIRDNGEPLDDDFGPEDIAPETVAEMRAECADFLRQSRHLLTHADDGYTIEQAAHDFWLTRNHHGAGFWDRASLRGNLGELLTEIAHNAGQRDLYVGDNGSIYQ